MPSLDFIYDITEKLDEEELDYLVLAIREGRNEDKVDVFFNVRKSAEVGAKYLAQLLKSSDCY